MSRTIKLFKNHRTLYFAIGSTSAMFLYAKFILGHFSRGFTIDVGSNSLGLSFYYTLDILVSLGSGINTFKWASSIITYLIIFAGIMSALKTFLIKPKLH